MQPWGDFTTVEWGQQQIFAVLQYILTNRWSWYGIALDESRDF